MVFQNPDFTELQIVLNVLNLKKCHFLTAVILGWLFSMAQSSGKSLKETLRDALSKSNFCTAQLRFPFLCCCHTLVQSSALITESILAVPFLF